MSGLGRRRLAVGLAVPIIVFAVLVGLVGPDDFIGRLGAVDLSVLGGLVLLAGLGLLAMAGSFTVVAAGVGLGLRRRDAIVAYTEVNLADNLTPFGQAGGEPVAALFVSRRSKRPYEDCLAAVTAFDAVNFIPAVVVLAIGGGTLAVADATVPPELRLVVGGFAVVVTGVVVALGLVAARPASTRALLARLVAAGNRLVAWVPLVGSAPLSTPHRRVDGYADAIGRIAGSRRRVALAGTFSTVAFVCQGLVLWGAVTAIGASVSVLVAVLIVPVSLTAAVIPLPGGGGGIEGVQVLMLGVLAGIAPAPAITAVVLSRGIVYWLPVVLGGISLLSHQLSVEW